MKNKGILITLMAIASAFATEEHNFREERTDFKRQKFDSIDNILKKDPDFQRYVGVEEVRTSRKFAPVAIDKLPTLDETQHRKSIAVSLRSLDLSHKALDNDHIKLGNSLARGNDNDIELKKPKLAEIDPHFLESRLPPLNYNLGTTSIFHKNSTFAVTAVLEAKEETCWDRFLSAFVTKNKN